MSPDEMKPQNAGMRCEALRWSICELIDGLISATEREMCEKYFPGVPLLDEETRTDYDYESPEYVRCFYAFARAREAARAAEEAAMRAVIRDTMATFPALYRPKFEEVLQREMASHALG
jgi:hypothetical protein